MADTRAARRYALALIGLAEEQKVLNLVAEDFDSLERLLRDSREFALFLTSPVVSMQKKKEILSTILRGKVSELTRHFVLLLTSKDREKLLGETIQQFNQLRDERLGILNVTTRTAVKFTGEEERRLIQQIERATRKKVRLNYILDPSLRGGFVVQHDDTVWDASVQHQLELLRRRFVEGST